jgi:hypothetical protein
MEGQVNKKGTVWAIVVLALVVVVVLFYFVVTSGQKKANPYPKVIAPQLTATAPVGKIVAGMPNDLIFVKDAAIAKSEAYTTTSPSGMKVEIYTMTYKTAATVKNLYITYERYSTAHGYAPISGSLNPTSAIYSFRTTRAPNMIYRVSIVDNGQNREVNIIINKQ